MASILPDLQEKKQLHSRVSRFFRQAKIGTFLNQSHILKVKGFSPLFLIQFFFSLVLQGKTLNTLLHSDRSQNAPAKDAFYDLLKGATYNWRLFLSRVSSFLIVTCFKPLTGDPRNRVLIYDDSTYRRHRSKHVELLSRVRDHTTGHYVRGFRMPTLGWSDGVTFIPLAFSLLSSQKKKNRYQEMDASVDKRTLGYRRRKEALMKGTEVLFCLLDAINPLELGAQTLLFDSWFAFPGVIKRVVKNYPLQVICMLKRMPRVYYTYEGKRYTLNPLYHQIRKKRGRAKILASAFVGLGVDEDGSEQRAKIVFVRDHHRSKQWLALLTTSLEQTDEEVVRVYGKRWAIACFFKMTKSHLRLAKECQCRNYDALIAHTTIVFLRYIMLAWSAREEQDPRTLGNLFSLCCDEIEDLRFAEALMTLLELLSSTLIEEDLLTDEQIQPFLDRFFNKLPDFLRKPLLNQRVAV